MKRFRVMHCQNRYGNWRKVIIDTQANPSTPIYSMDVIDHVFTTEHDTRSEAVKCTSRQRRPI